MRRRGISPFVNNRLSIDIEVFDAIKETKVVEFRAAIF